MFPLKYDHTLSLMTEFEILKLKKEKKLLSWVFMKNQPGPKLSWVLSLSFRIPVYVASFCTFHTVSTVTSMLTLAKQEQKIDEQRQNKKFTIET